MKNIIINLKKRSVIVVVISLALILFIYLGFGNNSSADLIRPVAGQNKLSGVSDDSSNITGEIKEYDFKEAIDHVGENAKVTGKVIKIYTAKSGVTFFDFCENYKDCPFSAVLFASDLEKFGDLKQYQRDVKISGTIKLYNGKSQIILNDKEQIE